jgi:arginine utilization regulatory protein
MTERMKRSRKSLQAQYSFDDIIGENAELKKTIALAKQAAKTDLPVFIFGETGTGKELFAQSVHNGSVFSKGPFVAVNCAAIPDNLLESLLFGTVKGAFTGAENRAGLLEHAAGGSVFFDEVQALSSQMQAKLLRTLQEKTFQRVGSVEQIPFQARVISATNIAPEKAVAENALREDLYYRLCVFVVTIPPLKDRKDDLLLLSRYFLQDFNSKTGKEYRGIHPDSMRSFQNYHWPGNVRELEHLLLSQSIINDPDERGLLKIEPYSSSRLPQKELPTFSGKNLPKILLEAERRAVMQALQEHDSNVTKASAALGITRQSLQYRMSKLEIAVEREATISPKEPEP